MTLTTLEQSRTKVWRNLLCMLTISCPASMFFFFFQAEDGIRDYKVTGVQTCALPISAAADGPGEADRLDQRVLDQHRARLAAVDQADQVLGEAGVGGRAAQRPGAQHQIGRASCRERV